MHITAIRATFNCNDETLSLNKDLGYRLKVGAATVSILFREWLSRMAHAMTCFVKWLSKKIRERNIPQCFREANLENVTCIIDCSEIFIDTPFNIDARAQTISLPAPAYTMIAKYTILHFFLYMH